MEITLEKIELVKDRTGVTYAEAKEALEANEGSVVDAIIAIEETVNAGKKKRGFGERGEDLFGKLKALVKKGNVARIKVRKEDDTVLNVPVNAGILGIAIAPLASVVAVVAAFGFKCAIEVVKTDGTVVDVSDAVTDTVSNVAEKSGGAAEKVKEKAAEFYEKGKSKADEYSDKLKDTDLYDKAKDAAGDLKDKAEDLADDLKEKAEDLKGKAGDIADDLKEKAENLKDKAEEKVEEAVEAAEEAAEEEADAAEEAAEEATEEVKEETEDAE